MGETASSDLATPVTVNLFSKEAVLPIHPRLQLGAAGRTRNGKPDILSIGGIHSHHSRINPGAHGLTRTGEPLNLNQRGIPSPFTCALLSKHWWARWKSNPQSHSLLKTAAFPSLRTCPWCERAESNRQNHYPLKVAAFPNLRTLALQQNFGAACQTLTG